MKGLKLFGILLISLAGFSLNHVEKPFLEGYYQPIDQPSYGSSMGDVQKYFEQNLPAQLLEKSFVRLIFKVTVEANGTVKQVNPINHPLEIDQETEVVKLISAMKWNQMNSAAQLHLILVIANHSVTIEIR
jgi:hypothetical protein